MSLATAINYGTQDTYSPGTTSPSREHPPLPRNTSFNRTGQSPLLQRHGRGMTFDQIQRGGILSPDERSLDFEHLALDEKSIGRLTKKVRPYYLSLSALAGHYAEVDSLLSGSLPHIVATSFRSPNDDISDYEDTETWLRKNSTWSVRRARRESQLPASEETGLLSEGKAREAKRERLARIALNVNTIVNILLVAAKVIAVLYSSSISLTASLVDSALDTLSTFIILGTNYGMGVQTDRHKYPAGTKRYEPLGVLIFSVVMIASFVQVFIEAFQRAIRPENTPFDLSVVGAATMVATIIVKAVLWAWCSRIPSSGVQALAQDAENDVMLNIISLSFPSVGTFLGWRLLDPIGGMVLSAYIIIEWIKTLLENFEKLSGKSASPDQVTRVLYLVTRFNPVLEIADVECYHIGDDLIVEVDVILPQGSTLHFAHDVGETIQCCLESLEGVLRAYVHVDYSASNPPQHTSRVPGSSLGTAPRKLAPLVESPGVADQEHASEP